MNTTRRSNHRLALVIAALVAASTTAGQAADGQLKWTPHRAADAGASTPDTDPATAPAATSAPAAMPQPVDASAAPSSTAPAAAPAAVVLPDEVPRTVARRPLPPSRPRPAPPQAERSTPNRISGAMQRAFDPANPNGVFGEGIMRTPQGDARRQILAPEGSQAVAMQKRAAAVELAAAGSDRLGGGLAPRYTATPGSRPRIDRLAMNADDIPSVMAQRAQVGALDDAAVPGRAPTTGTVPDAAAPPAVETIPTPPPSAAPSVADETPMSIDSFEPGMEMDPGMEGMPADDGSMMGGDGGLLMGDYPAQLHVESFYDDPYACEDDDPLCHHSGRFCAWLRRFGKPYYGWRWYRDFTASAGVTAFTNDTNLGIHGNYGTNEYLNWAMPFWNAFGVGWQLGWRGTQTNFQPATLTVNGTTFTKNARDQNFVTTGFFTRAFEGRGLQGGAVYDYLSDSWLDNADIAQVRGEISYVWGYHEIGFWGSANITDQVGFLRPRGRVQGVASTVDLYTGFYRLQFGDANELKVWGGGTGDGEGIVGTLLRAPLARSFAMEGTFTYLIPGQTRSIDITGSGVTTNFSPAAWNVGLNLVYYPAGRSRRGLASPYRPLFEVADNGSMIREFSVTRPRP